ncbi:type II toxin-antitoxin system HicA family toxin [uncultured Vagococcus sp.]|uniref:type II toxin-antitoxin system HicA family toxin n=1 Tax=uncultured Vagococcus sp. TaxID=189676 RepID=UPI0028D7BB67|nr:type II toxin-antitoxin system HicA family toxin [uncultured Vagococcus sp.]
MKKRDLENKFKKKGWSILRSGGKHDIWSNGNATEQIPRHREINERLAQSLIKKWGL